MIDVKETDSTDSETSEVNTSKDNATPPQKKGVARLIAAFRYSAAGLRSAFHSEEAIRMEVAAFLVMAPLGLWLGGTAVEKVLLVGSLVLVFIIELLNTAIERVVDRWGEEYHDLSREAKDIGSAAVFTAIALVFFIWVVLLLF